MPRARTLHALPPRPALPLPTVPAPRPIPSRRPAGPAHLPVAVTPYGRLSGAICFDLDHPSYVRAAGAHRADLMLQPSWTWGSIGPRHFASDMLRAVENGFTLFRCLQCLECLCVYLPTYTSCNVNVIDGGAEVLLW